MKERVIYLGFMLIFWFYFPLLSIIFLVFSIKIFTNNKALITLIFVLLSLSMGLLAYTQDGSAGKMYDTDIERYYFTYNLFSEMTFLEFYKTRLYTTLNPLFDITNFILSKIFTSTPQVLSLFWISLSYFINFITIDLMTSFFGRNYRKKYLSFLIFTFIFIFSIFTFSADLIKQFSATSIFLLSLILKIKNRKNISIVYLTTSILIHTSVIILIPIYLFYSYFNKMFTLKNILFFLIVIFIISNLSLIANLLSNTNLLYFSLLGDKSELIAESEKIWNIHYLHMFLLSLFGFSVYYSSLALKKISQEKYFSYSNDINNREVKILYSVLIISLIILITNITNMHNFLRYLNTYGILYVIPLLFSIYKNKNNFLNVFTLIYLMFFGFYSNYYLYMRSFAPNRPYGVSFMNNDIITLLTSNIVNILGYVN